MEHPLIHDADTLSVDELQQKISDLTKKYSFAARVNAHLAGQIQMALTTYQNQYQIKMRESMTSKNSNSGFDPDSVIDIS